MTIKEQVLEIIERNFKIQSGGDVEDVILEEIQALEPELTMQEVQDYCLKQTDKGCKFCRLNEKITRKNYTCWFDDDNHLFYEDICSWNIPEITKIVRGDK